jgi:transglutaminase-like putative cysteine protease
MSIKVNFHHQLHYRYDRPIILGPQTLGLRPAPHSKTPIHSYSLKIEPRNHSITWQQDPYGNFLARINFPDPTDYFNIDVDLIAQLQPINPFNFVMETYGSQYPFRYEPQLEKELIPFLEITESGPQLQAWVKQHQQHNIYTPTFLTTINQQLAQQIQYTVRFEPGIQTCEHTLIQRLGSCRDTAWLLVQILRHYGLAARFASGYLIQLQPDVPPLEGQAGPESDHGDLHAWAEVYLPGAGWIGLDPTSGFMAAEGHIPLVCTADPEAANPVQGTSEACESVLDFAVNISRYQEVPRVTKPYTDHQWQSILAVGEVVENKLQQWGVDLTMSGELTFVSRDNEKGASTQQQSQNTIQFQATSERDRVKAKILPIADWKTFIETTSNIYESARLQGWQTEQYLLEGRAVNSGSGLINIGGEKLESNPFFKCPNLLQSLIVYWHNHPSLSYLFLDHHRKLSNPHFRENNNLYELEIVFQALNSQSEQSLEIIVQFLQKYLIDITQNSIHVDQLFSQNQTRGTLQFMGFATAPHFKMSILQVLLLRGLIALFVEKPYTQPFIRWGTTRQDRFGLPYFIKEDLKAVLTDLNTAGYAFELAWFNPFFEFCFPQWGVVIRDGIQLQLRHGIEPDDAAIERLQVLIQGAIGHAGNQDSFSERYQVLCNGHVVPLKSTGIEGEYVGGVRFRNPQPSMIKSTIVHPAFQPHESLLFEIVDTWSQRSIGGCTYYLNPPNGMIYQTTPINPREAESRRIERFIQQGHTVGQIQPPAVQLNPEYPLTLDLRWVSAARGHTSGGRATPTAIDNRGN